MLSFIVNPTSSSGNAAKIWEKISAVLAKRKITYNACLTDGPGSASRHAAAICESDAEPTIVVIGGDGTLNEVVSGIKDLTRVTMGYIPAGSSNDFARDIGITSDPVKALEAILNPAEYIRLDIGKVTAGEDKRSFVVSCGVGYDASVCHEALHSNIKDTLNKFHLGKLTYLVIALRQLIRMPKQSCTITIDGGETINFSKYIFVAAMNHRYEGGGFMFAPDAKYDDGILDVCCAHNISKLKVLRILPTAFKGRHIGFKGIDMYKAEKIVITSSLPACVHADGESVGVHSEIVIEMRTGQLKMIYR